MGGAVNVGVLVLVEILQTVDYRLRFLCGGRVIEPNQRTAIHALLENWEVPANLQYVQWLPACRRWDDGGGGREFRGGILEKVIRRRCYWGSRCSSRYKLRQQFAQFAFARNPDQRRRCPSQRVQRIERVGGRNRRGRTGRGLEKLIRQALAFLILAVQKQHMRPNGD